MITTTTPKQTSLNTALTLTSYLQLLLTRPPSQLLLLLHLPLLLLKLVYLLGPNVAAKTGWAYPNVVATLYAKNQTTTTPNVFQSKLPCPLQLLVQLP